MERKIRVTIEIILIVIISAFLTLTINSRYERNKAIAELENSIFSCQNSIQELYDDLQGEKDYFIQNQRITLSRLNYNIERARDFYDERDVLGEMYYARPSLSYLEDLYKFILWDGFNDVELFGICVKPFLETYFDGDLWAFLDDLDTYLQTDDGMKAYLALRSYYTLNPDTSFQSYCCVYEYYYGTPCIHTHNKTK